MGHGVRLFYQDEGTGQPVVLVHGLVADYRVWNLQITPLSRQFKVIAYNLRFSSPNKNPQEVHDDIVENDATDLLELIRNLGIVPVHLVGHSYGGLIATYLAYKHPELLRSLTLIEPTVFSVLIENRNSAIQRLILLLTHPSVASDASDFESNVIKKSVNTLMHGDPQGAVRILVDGDQGKSGAFEQFSDGFRSMAVENAASIYVFGSNWNVLKKKEISQIKVPTLIIHGENTRKSSGYIANSIHRLISTSTEDVIARSGHFPQTENPEELNSKLLGFLAKNSS